MSKPEVEVQYHIHCGDWKYVVKDSPDHLGLCDLRYIDENGDGTQHTKEIGLGDVDTSRAIAHAILKWCDEVEGNHDASKK
jgi:hypothetical protein